MSTQSEALKQSKLINRLVLDRQTAEEVGHVAQLLLDGQAQQVVGFICKSGGWLGGQQQVFPWSQVEAIGDDSVLVKSREEATAEIPESLKPPIGYEIWTDGGNKVGKLLDFLFDPRTGAVVNYLFSSSGWRGVMEGTYLLQPVAISSVGSRRVIVLEKAVQAPQQYTQGLSEKLEQATEFIREDYEKTREDWEVARQGTQQFVEKVKGATHSATETVQQKVSEVKTQFKSEDGDTQSTASKDESVSNPENR